MINVKKERGNEVKERSVNRLNMIVLAPSEEDELAHMVATAAYIDDSPVCFRYPRGSVVGMDYTLCSGIPLEVFPWTTILFLVHIWLEKHV